MKQLLRVAGGGTLTLNAELFNAKLFILVPVPKGTLILIQ